MCGIAGLFGPETAMAPTARLETVKRMCRVIEHRGPDDEGIHIEAGLAIGMRRLSIIDLATGHQPISNEDGSVWIVFNGEIYNFAELRSQLVARGHAFKTRTDTETIVHLYEEEGERCVERLRGMFAFAIYDARERKLFLARDRVGIKPLHYFIDDDSIVFGSEIKSILQHPQISREVDFEAICDFLSFGYVPGEATAFRGIRKLLPGHTLTFKDGRAATRRYWDFDYRDAEGDPQRDESYYVERLRELIAESVRMRLISEVPLGAFLSGGIDSSTVVAMMAREMDRPVKTFSIGFSDPSFDELSYARVAANHLATEHHEFVVTPDVCRIVEEIIWHHDEPFADASSIPTYIVSKMAREHVTVVLSGDGGDELFAGYERYVVDRSKAKFERIPAFIRRHLMLRASRALPRAAYGKNFLRNISLEPDARYVEDVSYFNEDVKREMLSASFLSALGGRDSAASFKQIYHSPKSSERLERLLYLDSKTYLPGDILTKVDRMSMAHSIEARVPLLDHKLIEFVQSIPASLKLRGLETKHILKQAVRGIIPQQLIERPKQGFAVPLNRWFKNELREMLSDTLSDRRTRERGYFNHARVMAILDEHNRGRRDNALHLWGLLSLELWHRAFIDSKPEPSFAGAKHVELDRLAFSAKAAEGNL